MYKHLYDTFNHWYRGGTIYFYSDPHFSDEEMKYLRKNYIGDEEQVKRINSKVGKNDTIIFLGDVGNIDFIRKIKGYKVLIMGNHDAGATNYKRQQFSQVLPVIEGVNNVDLLRQMFPEYKIHCSHRDLTKVLGETGFYSLDNHLFDEVYEGPLMISDKILLSHEPIDLPFIFNLHGHDHSNTQFKDDKHFNMCAENIDYTPIGIKEIINSGKLSKIDSIHRQTIDRATEKKKKRN